MKSTKVFVYWAMGGAMVALSGCQEDHYGTSAYYADRLSRVPMSTTLVDAEGRRLFKGSHDAVSVSTIGALRTLGYVIAFTDPAGGVIKTEPLRVSETAELGWGGSAVGTTYKRSYSVTLVDTPDGVVVRAAPRLFANGQDISSTAVWTLDGPNGERAQWARLFSEIASNLAVTPSAPAASVPPPAK